MLEKIWTWDNCRDKIKSLSGRLGFSKSSTLEFLKLRLSLEDGRIFDEIRNEYYKNVEPIYCVLTGYADAKPISESGKLISFSKLPGGDLYRSVFLERVAKPIEHLFNSNPELLYETAKIFNASRLDFGDCSVKINALPLIPIVYVIWGEDEEFPASVNILFDSTVKNYLTTEQTVLLSELTSIRLKHAYKYIVVK
ncbi:MAG: hypothetical protein DRJ38_08325 [Thermoprotei archaeon]|nr:MAG: hypothetical protein DRJ38_08325 [Thermoprotei archaeon]